MPKGLDAYRHSKGRPAGSGRAAQAGRRTSSVARMYVSTWATPETETPEEVNGPEAGMTPYFHSLREQGKVFLIELGSLDGGAHVAWVSWRNPTMQEGRPGRCCPHCGGELSGRS